jgi:hypothetical protein
VLAVYGVGQVLEAYVLVPWLVGDRIGLHPLAVIFALLAFGSCSGLRACCWRCPASAALLVGCGTCAPHTSIRRCIRGSQ